jgi:putative PIN family toxin of toxin-antitoxin system
VYTDEQAREFCALLRGFAHLTAPPSPAPPVSRDPNDDMVIACAVAAQATYLVTRDKDLLTLAHYQKIRMTTPEQFMEILRK